MTISYANEMKRTPADSRELTKKYGKVIDELTWTIDGLHYRAELRNQRVKGSYRFACTCQIRERPNGYVNIPVLVAVGTEANETVKKVRAELEKHVLVTWTPFMYLTVYDRSEKGRDDLSEGMSIGMEYVLVGERPDGSKCHRRQARRVDKSEAQFFNREIGSWRSDSEVEDGMPRVGEPGKERGWNENGHRGLIPWSEEAEARVKVIIQALKDLRDRVSSMLGSEDSDRVLRAVMQATPLIGD